jgi:hypothetical protein
MVTQPTASTSPALTAAPARPGKSRLNLPSRRKVLEALAAAGLSFSLGSFNPVSGGRGAAPKIGPYLPKLKLMRDALQIPARLRATGVSEGKLARSADKKEDEFTYAVDVGQLLCYFAIIGDKDPYLALRHYAARELVVDIKEDPFTKGFVLWRTQPGAKPDASGTTEALRIAKGLWIGAKTFDRPDDRTLAMAIVDGYGRHQNVDQGLWLIRNYFHFYSRAFASNSFIIDYDPDFLREVAEDYKDEKSDGGQRYRDLSSLADHSYDVLRASVAPCGLIYDLLQPELKTMYYGLDVAYFSPNDIIQLNNACATAATVARGDSAVADDVIGFIADRLGVHPSTSSGLRRSKPTTQTSRSNPTTRPIPEDETGRILAHYYGRTGESVNKQGIGATEYCAIIRLAGLRLDDTALYVIGRCIEQAMAYWEYNVAHADKLDAWTTSEMLLGLQAILDMKEV